MSTQFVEMYHPLIPSTAVAPARVALQSVDDWAVTGWLLVDPDVTPPAPSTPYLTRLEAASKYLERTDVLDPDGLVREAALPARLSEVSQGAVAVQALEDATSVAPTGAWDFTQAPTVAGVNIGAGDSALAVGTEVLYVRPGGDDTEDGLSWKTAKQTLAAAISALPSGGVIEVAGQHTISTALPQPANSTLIRGRGHRTRITWAGIGRMLELVNAQQVHFESLRFTLSNAASTAFYLSNSFRCSWTRCVVDGQHVSGSGSTYRTQIGFQFRANAGDNRIINCDLNNLGEAVQADTIMNYMVGCVVGSCWTGVHVDAGSFTGGFAIDDCTFVGTSIGAAQVRAHVLIDVAANQTWITNSWFEGCTVAIQAGVTGVGGPYGMVIQNCRLAATSKCLDIQSGRQFRLDTVRFATDSGATPTEITVNAEAVDGFATNLLSTSVFDITRTTFPANWTYLSRSNEDAQISSKSMQIGVGTTAGQSSLYKAGADRSRFGYDGSKTVVQDPGRDVALVSGSSNRQVAVDASGVFYVGSKTANTPNAGGMVVGVVIQNAVTEPTASATNSGILWVANGVLKYRGPNGTVTTLAPS